MPFKQRLGLLAVIAVALFLIVPGCGQKSKPKGSVAGKVTLNGQPYGDAAIVFLNSGTGQGGSVNLNPDGSFQLPQKLEVGTYIVYLAPKAEEDPAAEPKPVSIDKTVPEKYWNEASSDIRVEVKAGSNNFPIELKK